MIPKDRTSALAIGLLVLTALTVRLIELDQHFLLIDEGFVGVAARDIAFNNTPMWDAVSNAPYVWGLAQLISILGDTPFVLRLPSALFGASVSVLIFLFLRRWAGQKTAVLSAAIYALHPFGAAFTRVAFVDALQLPVLLLAVAAIDNYLLKHERRWLWIALISAAIAFILKYNALAILGCWMFVGLLLGRYPIKRSIGAGLGIVVLSLGTLLLWPFNAPVWFFSFLAKGGSYDSNYIINFYEFAYRHVVFGTATLPIAIIGYALARFSLDKEIAQRFDHLVVFSLAYYALLLILGRPFQRYLLVLTVPVAMVYAMIVVQGYRASRRWIAERDLLDLLRAAAGLAVTLGILIHGT
ncbi:MAG TPA: glycosyltransferase family 39 protein, partial [Candidatus Kapabacteria bacterium]|nr:glycosyltransferase family 39 protein [Candidatus Kapabacteria bacterium]